MSRAQIGTVIVGVLLLVVLLVGFSNKPSKASDWEKSRQKNASAVDMSAVILKEKEKLEQSQALNISLLEAELSKFESDSMRAEVYKLLSSKWYEIGSIGVAAHYAEEVAELLQSEEAWNIAGSSFKICFDRESEERLKTYCMQKAIQSFESVVSINPDNIEGRINLALCYVAAPPSDQPMTGVLMLRDLSEKYPENSTVLFHLARLSLQTNQLERAVERIEKAMTLDPDNKRLQCLAWEIYTATGQQENAEKAKQNCI